MRVEESVKALERYLAKQIVRVTARVRDWVEFESEVRLQGLGPKVGLDSCEGLAKFVGVSIAPSMNRARARVRVIYSS